MPKSRHSPAIFSPSSSRAMNFSRSSIGLHSFQGILLSLQKARLCNPCLRNELSPLSQEGHRLQRVTNEGRSKTVRYRLRLMFRKIMIVLATTAVLSGGLTANAV